MTPVPMMLAQKHTCTLTRMHTENMHIFTATAVSRKTACILKYAIACGYVYFRNKEIIIQGANHNNDNNCVSLRYD